jgi:hypothetical protein
LVDGRGPAIKIRRHFRLLRRRARARDSLG